MPRSNVKQLSNVTVEPTVGDKTLTVEYWRERFKKSVKKFSTLVDVADLLAELDGEFSGARGFIRLQNINNRKGGLLITSKAVLLMDQLIVEGKNRKIKAMARKAKTTKSNGKAK